MMHLLHGSIYLLYCSSVHLEAEKQGNDIAASMSERVAFAKGLPVKADIILVFFPLFYPSRYAHIHCSLVRKPLKPND